MSKCRVCKAPAVIDLPRHNANFCAEHLQQLCRRQVEKAIKDFAMLTPGERVLVAVSGGKDSLAVWDLLVELGYEADGLYVGLGIGEYSDESGEYTLEIASGREARHCLSVVYEDAAGNLSPAGSECVDVSFPPSPAGCNIAARTSSGGALAWLVALLILVAMRRRYGAST